MNELQEQVRSALTGPVCSIPTPFDAAGEIDYPTIAQMIDFQLAAGFGMIFLTPGNSHFACLRDREVAELCRFTIQHTARRAPVCICSFHCGTNDTMALAGYARECGADLLLPQPPVWGNGVTPDDLTLYYCRVAEALPLMLLFSPLPQSRGALTHLQAVFTRLPDRVLAIKDDFCNALSRELTAEYAGRCPIFSGGQKQNFLNIKPYGASGFLSTLGMFRPEITREFWRAVDTGDEAAAARIVATVDTPFFQLLLEQPGSFDAGIHAVLELYGFGTRHRRPPYHTLDDREMEPFLAGLARLGLLP